MTLSRDDWRRVKHVLGEALSLDPAEWSRFLAGACGGDAALRRQVEALLAAHARAESFLERPADEVLNLAVAEDSPPSRIGPFHVARVLGRGGMGVVYSGVHEATGARAAIKTVLAPKADKLLQIRREIEALARLRHPGVVRILDHGVDQGRPWYAMDLLEYPMLATAAPTRSRAEQLGLVGRLCETLAYVHGEGIVHGDLTPRNVLVAEGGLPVLVDFGLVAHVGAATGREVLDRTRTAGSAKYMSPEQIDGDLPDPRSDLYAVGCMLYELITGRVPFDGSIDEVIAGHRSRPVQPPSTLVSDVPVALDTLVLGLLRKRPAERLAYATDVAVALSHLGAAVLPPYVDATAARPYLCRPPLVGRREALEQLDAVCAGASRGSGAVVLISGDSGVGKTRLALEAARRASARRYSVVSGAATVAVAEGAGVLQPESPPLSPLTPLLQAIGDRCTEGGEKVTKQLIGDRGPVLAAYEPALRQLPGQRHLPPPPAIPAAQSQLRLFRCLADSLSAYATSAPLVVLLDDLQWSDELTLGFVAYLANGRITSMPVVVIATYRTEEGREGVAAIARSPAAIRIGLARLSDDEVGGLVGGMLSLADPPRGFVRFLAEKSEGNPYFVTEYLRMAVSERILVRNALGQLVFSDMSEPAERACESLPLPQSLHDVIRRRLQMLPALARQAVRCAAVVGREFDAATVQLAGGLGDSAIGEAIDQLVDRQLVESTDGASWRFTHDTLREMSCAELPDVERRRLHGQIAGAIERLSGESPEFDRKRASVGRHWAAAGDPARAIPHLHKAGDRAAALHALRDAVALYRDALVNIEMLGPSDGLACVQDENAIREKLADALTLSGAHAEGRAQLQRALARSEAGEALDQARLHCKIGRTFENDREFEAALSAYAAADGLLGAPDAHRPLPWLRQWTQVQLRRAWIWYWKGEPNQIDGYIARVGPYIETPGLAPERSLYYQVLGTRDFRRYRYAVSDQMVEYGRGALRAAEEAGSAADEAFGRFMIGFSLLLQGRLDEATHHLGEARAQAQDIGDIASEVRCLAYLAIAGRRAHDVDEARRWSDEVLSAGRTTGMSDYAAIGQAGLGWVAWKGGDIVEARTASRSALDSWAQSPAPFPFQWIARLTLLAIDLDQAEVDDLVALVQPLLEPGQARLPDSLESALQEAVTAHRRGDLEGTRRALGRLRAAATQLHFL
jgi:tetratricopeptide (TPR) repeat protein